MRTMATTIAMLVLTTTSGVTMEKAVATKPIAVLRITVSLQSASKCCSMTSGSACPAI